MRQTSRLPCYILNHLLSRNHARRLRPPLVNCGRCETLPPALQPLAQPLATRRWDVVLAADCVFWMELFQPLLDTLAALASLPPPPASQALSQTPHLGH